MPKLNIIGLDAVLQKLDPKIAKQKIIKSLQAYGRKVVTDAKMRCPVDVGPLRNSIFAVTDDLEELKISFTAGVDYAPYVEFGTGPFAAKYVPSLQPEWQAIAKEYFVSGKGRMPARPFLYPAVMNNINIFNEELEKQLK